MVQNFQNNLKLAIRKIYLIFLGLGLSAILYAYLILELTLGLQPCILCVLLRFEVIIMFIISLIGLVFRSITMLFLLFLSICSMIASTAYHLKIQFFSAAGGCQEIDLKFLNFLYKYVTNYDCSVISLPIFPLSTQSFLFSLFSLFLLMTTVIYYGFFIKNERKIW